LALASIQGKVLYYLNVTYLYIFKCFDAYTFFNLSYLPLTVHWSLEKSSFPDVLVGVFGGFASIFQIYAAWQATA
jgi:hypothetical protein